MSPIEQLIRRIVLNRAATLAGNESRRAGWVKASREYEILTGRKYAQGA